MKLRQPFDNNRIFTFCLICIITTTICPFFSTTNNNAALLLAAAVSSSMPTGAEDLISARCQAKCLSELEQRHKNNSEARRLLRHQISTFCKEDVQCSSCILPCREMVLDGELCVQTLCRDTLEPNQCRQSCAFLEQIAAHKPGLCPRRIDQTQNSLETECSAFCDIDSDCPEIEKCCQIGCSRTCLGPILNDTRLLPRPDGITLQERKRKRSAILRWIMKRLTPEHTSTSANLFVIQWRWSVHKQPEAMTPWQTVMVRNKMYAILKHLLAPGRYYLFRVAAVNIHGTYGFSQPSHPAFKLSQEVKAPSAPSNLTVLPLPSDYGHKKIGWAPPESELPIKEYRLSWWQISPELARAFELRQRRSSSNKNKDAGTPLDEDYDGGTTVEMAEMDEKSGKKKTLILPSYSTNAELDDIERSKIYMVELYATAESSEGELRGEPAILFLKANKEANQMVTKVPTMTASTSTTTTQLPPPEFVPFEVGVHGTDFADDINNRDVEPHSSSSFMIDLKTPFFEKGRLKTILSWLHHSSCAAVASPTNDGAIKKQPPPPQFRVLIRSIRCLNQLPPQNFLVNSCVATLENLQFRCEYYVRVEQQQEGETNNKNGSGDKNRLISRLTFATLPCEQTPSDVPLHCEKEQQQQELPAEAMPLGAPSTLDVPVAARPSKSTTIATTARTTTAIAITTTAKPNRNLQEKKQIAKNHRGEEQNGGREGDEPEEGADEEQEDEEEWLPIEEVTNEMVLEEKTTETGRPRERNQSNSGGIEKPQLNCTATGIGTADCSWRWPADVVEQRNNRLIGFRTVLSSTLKGAPSNVTVVKPAQRRLHLNGLNPKAVYRFRLQAVTTHGLGAELVEHFSTGHFASRSSNAKNNKNANADDNLLSIHVGTSEEGAQQFHSSSVEELPWSAAGDTDSLSSSALARIRSRRRQWLAGCMDSMFLLTISATTMLLTLTLF